MTLLAVICLNWKLQLVEKDGEGGLEWATPNCKIQIFCSPEITVVWTHVWSSCLAYLEVCLSFSSSVVHLFEIHLALKWLVSLLQLSNVRVRIFEGSCVLSLDGSKMCMYVTICEDFTSCGVGRGSTWGWDRQQGINMSKYILTNAFDVPVRIGLASWDRGQLSAAD